MFTNLLSKGNDVKAIKFTFGTSFDAPAQAKKAPPVTFSEHQMMDAEAAAFAKGKEAGHAQAMADIAERTAATCAALADAVTHLMTAEASRHAQTQIEAVNMALAIARKLAPALIAAEPLAEISRVVGNCLSLGHREARILVRVAEELTDSVKHACDTAAQGQGFMGKLVILGDPALHASDCRVEWADGGCERDSASLDQEIDQIIARYIEARRPVAGSGS